MKPDGQVSLVFLSHHLPGLKTRSAIDKIKLNFF